MRAGSQVGARAAVAEGVLVTSGAARADWREEWKVDARAMAGEALGDSDCQWVARAAAATVAAMEVVMASVKTERRMEDAVAAWSVEALMVGAEATAVVARASEAGGVMGGGGGGGGGGGSWGSTGGRGGMLGGGGVGGGGDGGGGQGGGGEGGGGGGAVVAKAAAERRRRRRRGGGWGEGGGAAVKAAAEAARAETVVAAQRSEVSATAQAAEAALHGRYYAKAGSTNPARSKSPGMGRHSSRRRRRCRTGCCTLSPCS